MRGRRGITLVELMIAAGLVAILYTAMAYITVQVSQASRRGSEAAIHKLEMIKSAEQLRWQLRGLYIPVEYSVKPVEAEASPGASPTPPATVSPTPDPSGERSARPGFIPGKLVLNGERSDKDESDLLMFLTNQPVGARGVAEVGYKLLTVDGRTALYYRQFNYRDPNGLHLPADIVEAPWKPINKDVVAFWCEYSSEDSGTWQREWNGEEPPRRIRINLSTRSGEHVSFIVSPGVSSARW